MSERLDQLAAQLGQMCEGVPVDVTNEATTFVLASRPRCRNAVRKHVLQTIVRHLLNRR